MEQILEKGKAKARKGSVLFTVVTVMMVMVVFLMSTLILTTSANRRSFYTYFETQAQYAAQAALDAVTNAAYSEQEFFNWVNNLPATGGEIDLEFRYLADRTQPFDTSANDVSANPIEWMPRYECQNCGATFGTPQTSCSSCGADATHIRSNLRCTVQEDGSTFIWDSDVQRIVPQRAYKITVTATVGTGKNAAEYTTCNYIYSKVGSNVKNDAYANVANWTLVTGITEKTKTTTIPGGGTGTPGSIADAVYQLSPLSSGNNMHCLGPSSSGLSKIPVGRLGYGVAGKEEDFQKQLFIQNDPVAVSNMVAIGNTWINTKYYVHYQQPKEGTVIYGNLALVNNAKFYSDLKTPATKYEEIPYVYVDGVLSTCTADADYFGGVGKSGTAQPVNLYLGGMTINNKNCVYGDIYLYDPDITSSYKGAGDSNLYHFADNNINKANQTGAGYIGGTMICNNEKLIIDSSVTIGGDLIMTNPNGTLEINAKLTVEGAIVCAGNLHVKTDENLKVDGGIYVDPNKFTTDVKYVVDWEKTTQWNNPVYKLDEAGNPIVESTTFKCNDKTTLVEACNASAGYTDKHGNTIYNDATSCIIPALGSNGAVINATDYATLVSTLLGKSNGAYPDDYATGNTFKINLFPYENRIDEIFDNYTRWDLKENTEAAAKAHYEAGNDQDPLIKESIKAGHTWGHKTVVCDNGPFYVPYTTSVSGHNFINVVKPVSSSTMSSRVTYYNTEAAFKTAFPDATGDAPVTKMDVTFPCHDKDGILQEITIKDAYVINKSGVVDLSQFTKDIAGDRPTVFIDQTANAGVSNEKLNLIFKGATKDSFVDIVVNNTCKYDGTTTGAGIYSSYTSYEQLDATSDSGIYAGRDDVNIFWLHDKNDIATQQMNVMTTGIYYQKKSTDKVINVISNPVYPDGKNKNDWNNLTGDNLNKKYAFELVPNVRIYGEAETYNFKNGVFFNAEVIMPDSIFNTPSGDSETKSKLWYRENNDCFLYKTEDDVNNNLNVNCVGSMMVADFKAQNVPVVAYIGDMYRGGTSTTTTIVKDEDVTHDDFSDKSQNAANGGDYFANDHQAAS